MNFERKSKRDEKRRNAEVDRLAKAERNATLRGKVKKLAGEALLFGACCLLGAILGILLGAILGIVAAVAL